MTNEELAQRIQEGERALMADLWEQVQRLVVKLLLPYAPNYALYGNVVDLDDLTQAGYLAVHMAVKDYDPARGFRFNTYLAYHVRNEAATLYGFRTGRQKRERQEGPPLALDEPLAGDEDGTTTRADLLPDESAAAALDLVIEQEYRRELHGALEVCLNELPPEQAEIIRARYYEGLTLAAIGEQGGHNPEWVRMQESRAKRGLRKPRSTRRLLPFLGESSSAYRSGYQSFVNHQASSTELTVERLMRG